MPISRLLLLVVSFGLMVWLFIVPSLNEPTTRGPASSPEREEVSNEGAPDPRTREEEAVWREQIDRRLYRR